MGKTIYTFSSEKKEKPCRKCGLPAMYIGTSCLGLDIELYMCKEEHITHYKNDEIFIVSFPGRKTT